MAPFTRGRALVIGVGEYDDARLNAPTATRDARSIHAALIDAGGAAYSPGMVKLLLDREATRVGVLAALTELANRCQEDSVALISITCHGAMGDDGLYYLATTEARFTGGPNGRVVQGTGLSVVDLARALRDIPARQLLLIVNACFAGDLGGALSQGGIAPDEPLGQMLPDEAGNTLLATGEGRAIITAGRADQRSYFKPEERHSYFGQALIDALGNAAASASGGPLGLYELYEGVYRQVRGVTNRRLGEAQEPVLTVIQNFGPFPVAGHPAGAGGGDWIAQRPAGDLPLRVVPQTVIQALGAGSTAINAGAGSTVTVDNSKLIDFGGATVMGGVTIGNVAKGDIININSPTTIGGQADLPPDPLAALPILKERVAVARNVDEDARDDAASKLNQAHRALTQGDRAKALQRIDEALALLRAMGNGYINSAVRKIEAVRDAI